MGNITEPRPRVKEEGVGGREKERTCCWRGVEEKWFVFRCLLRNFAVIHILVLHFQGRCLNTENRVSPRSVIIWLKLQNTRPFYLHKINLYRYVFAGPLDPFLKNLGVHCKVLGCS